MLSFLYGLLVSFSPCSLPLIPIILGMCKTTRGALMYLLGSTISYIILGIMLAALGIYFQGILQSWPVILLFSIGLLTLSLSCFNLIRLPQAYFHTSNIFLMGLAAPLICSPCMTPALGAIIIKMVQESCKTCGILDLFLFGLGTSVPMVLSLFGLNKLLKSNRVKAIMPWVTKINGVLLIVLIIYLWRPLWLSLV